MITIHVAGGLLPGCKAGVLGNKLWGGHLRQISERMVRRVDWVSSIGRVVALIPVLAYALLGPSSAFLFGRWALVIATLAMGTMDLVPVVLVSIGIYPHWVALGFVALDTAYALLVLILGGSIPGFYSFVPMLAASARLDWPFGIVDALVLAGGYLSILVSRRVAAGAISGLSGVLELGASHWAHLIALLLGSALAGQLFESVKRDPPLNAKEVDERQREIAHWQGAAERCHAVYELASTLSATLNPDTILDAVLDVCMAGLQELGEPAHAGSTQVPRSMVRLPSAVFLYGERGLYVAAARRIEHPHRDRVVPGARGLLAKVLQSCEPVVCGPLSDDPELARYAPLGDCQSALGVPFRSGFEVYGAVVLGSFAADAFGPEHIDLLSAVSSQAAVALTNARLYQHLQREKEHILEVEEQARSKLARDLHDGPTQAVSAIAMRLNYARLLMGRDPVKVRDELFSLENLARRTTKDIRTLLFTLRPLVLETQGLRVALEKLVEEFKETTNVKVALDLEDLDGQLDMNTQTVAWHVAEECLTNARKHANAQNVTVKMCVRDGYLVSEIEDDGKGFDVQSVMDSYDQNSSYGLVGLQERAELVNGRTTIESRPGKGTKISLSVPLSQEVT
jgi:signal transduction histidine kinase